MIIHMGWIGSDVPPNVAASFDKVREVAVGCEVMVHVGDDVIPERWNPAAFGYRLVPHMMSDIQRHAALMKHGGLWLDADVRVVRNPAEWASEFVEYTAVRLRDRGAIIGTDIIYADAGWSGWSSVDDYISSLVASRPKRISVLAMAHDMISECLRTSGAWFDIKEPLDVYPYTADEFSSNSVVARGFDPPAAVPDRPSFMQKARNFTVAAAQHVAAGMPLCSEEEIQRRHEICLGCEHYQDSTCTKCGCPIARQRAYLSKLSWADQECPVGKWGKAQKNH
jgi:hypothetical protein